MSVHETTVDQRTWSRVMPWLVGGAIGVAAGLGAGWMILASASTDAEVAALLDDYLAAWDAGDGEAVVSFMTEDGVHYSGGASQGKAANDDGGLGLAAFVEGHEWATFEPVSDPVVSEGPPYEAALIVRVSNGGQDAFEAVEVFEIVEADDGSLKIAVDSSEIVGID